jgi:Tol biopolymer transport system component
MRSQSVLSGLWSWVLGCSVLMGGQAGWAKTVECVSVNNKGLASTGNAGNPSISRNGRYVTFWAYGGLAGPYTYYPKANVFLRDRLLGVTELISISPDGTESGDGHSFETLSGAVSDDGRYVAFRSAATNLAPGTHASYQIYVRDRTLGTTLVASLSNAGAEGNNASWEPRITPDGRYVVFYTWAYNLSDYGSGVYLRDLVNNVTEYISLPYDGSVGTSGGAYPAITPNGRYVVFESTSTNIVPGDTNGASDIFLRDRELGTTTRLSVSSTGEQGDAGSFYPSISDDGRFVAFESLATNLVADDTNGVYDIFLHDRATGQTRRVNVSTLGEQANGLSRAPCLSADGGVVAFYSEATNLVPGDVNGVDDVFLHHWGTGQTVLVSTSAAGVQANADCHLACVSTDASVVAFTSDATNLVPGAGGAWNIFAVTDTPLAVRWPR